ncbi:MAG: serine O-acetyltransferase [Vicinamibacterales bacterium]
MTNTPFPDRIVQVREAHTAILPDPGRVAAFADDLLGLLFPHFSSAAAATTRDDVQHRLDELNDALCALLRPQQASMPARCTDAADQVFADLPEIYRKLWLDARAMHEGDPASESIDEVIACYPGFFAIYVYRLAHSLHVHGVPVLPRLFAEYAHTRTGIDIHPAARIGERFSIDHGTGVVVGGTSEIGDSVRLYQGVSLGALSVRKELAGVRRHPTIEDNVVIYSNATILGGQTTIGHDSVIGGNVWLTESVAPFSIVQHRSDVRVRSKPVADHTIDFVI